MNQSKLTVLLALVLAFAIGVGTELSAETKGPESPDEIVLNIRADIRQLLVPASPELYRRHLRSVLALCEDSVLRLQFAGADRDAQTKELAGYLRTIESGLRNDDARKPETYLVEGRRSLAIARLSRSDDTLQLYSVSLPVHWQPQKAYPLYVQLHGRWSDLPLALIASSFAPQSDAGEPNNAAIVIIPWLRGNGQWRDENGSEPDVWEAIDDLKTFAKIDPDRRYISGHSWGGDDVWSIVLRTPDLWAAAGIMAGSAAGVPSDLRLVANAQHVPFYLWKGAQDPIPNRQANLEYFRDSLAQVGDPPKVVIADGVGHNPRPEDSFAMQTWLFQYVRQRPSHFSFLIDTPQHRGAWGISIPQKFPDAYLHGEPEVSFECWTKDSTVQITTTNSRRVDVDFGPNGLNLSGTAKLIVNGKQLFEGPVPAKPMSFGW
jgi:pimeloyl-ACP methyl ester carboxylesterase